MKYNGYIKIDKKTYKSLAVYCEEEFSLTQCIKVNSFKNKQELKKMYVPTEENLKNYKTWKKNLCIENVDSQKAKLYKYRKYLKVVNENCDIFQEKNILTFVLFNPSSANQYTLDPTIQNCEYITSNWRNKKFNGFEILNLLNIRATTTDKISTEEYKKIISYNDIEYIFNDVIIACGKRSEYLKELNDLWRNLVGSNNKSTNYYYLSYINDKGNEINKTWHLDNRGWNRKSCPFKKNFGTRIKIKHIQLKNNESIILDKDGEVKKVTSNS